MGESAVNVAMVARELRSQSRTVASSDEETRKSASLVSSIPVTVAEIKLENNGQVSDSAYCIIDRHLSNKTDERT